MSRKKRKSPSAGPPEACVPLGRHCLTEQVAVSGRATPPGTPGF